MYRQLLLVACLFVLASAESRVTLDDYINTCLDGKYHKSKPGPEAALFDQCAPWRNRSCCTGATTAGMHSSMPWYNLDWNHCPMPLSAPCWKYMRQDLCFYECSPNVGPWIVPHKIRIRNERFLDVPLCRTECDSWFNACKNDFTCSNNWIKGWDWSSGTSQCPVNSTCRTFSETFATPEDMCRDIWGGSFKVVPDGDDDPPCMLLFFDGAVNPNDRVARLKAEELLNGGSTVTPHSWILLSVFLAAFHLMTL